LKKYLKFIEHSQLQDLLQVVEDHADYLDNNISNKLLRSKLKVKHQIEIQTRTNLNEFFNEKLIFKLFNECKWTPENINKKTNSKNISESIVKLAKNYNINIGNINSI